ncbi:cache domain-containing sensor histidine kinase [Paenibacillus puerhi]|uniref:cache domain-containing sensor histidine kinase n=1 Tax=Paenibacillus puerhi TaxID=2692622 RepID=UPI00135BA94A|nr:sensor histidine kinase [Paenibacillus puerhi]
MRASGFTSWPSLLRRCKLSTLIVVCFIGLNLVLFIGVIWLSYRAFSDVAFSEISKARLALLNESTKRGFDFMTQITNTAYSVVSQKEITERLGGAVESKYDMLMRRREISDKLHHMLVINTGISSIEIYSDLFNEVPYSSTDLVYPVSNISGEKWFSALKQADAVWIPAEEGDSSQSLIGYAQHMFNSRGETNGYLVIRMTQEDVLSHFADVPMVLEGQVLVVDTAGKIIIQVNDPNRADVQPIPDTDWLTRHSHNFSDGYELYRKGEHDYLVLFSKPNTVQWRLVQVIATSELLASTERAGWYVLVIGLLGLTISALLAYVLVKGTVRPLRRLMMEMKKLERGDFNAKTSSSFTEEYVQLSFSFNHMVSRLQELIDSVQKESKLKREAQTGLLEAQIKPHFLYNTLDMIHWRALDYKAEDISSMITQLGKLLRIGLSGGKLFIRVRDELEHARCYIGIQQVRQPFSIECAEQIDPHVRGYYIPKVILQPLIENSVIHGKPDQSGQALQLGLKIRELRKEGQGKCLELTLTDNGRGLPAQWKLEETTGIGIRNVHQRIVLYCGPHYGLLVENREEGGVRVTVRVPVIETEEQLKWLLDGENR